MTEREPRKPYPVSAAAAPAIAPGRAPRRCGGRPARQAARVLRQALWLVFVGVIGCGPTEEGAEDLVSQLLALQAAHQKPAAPPPLPVASPNSPHTADPSKWSEAARALWSDPAFQRKFQESYAASTDIEPTVTASEREQLAKIIPLKAEGKLDDAARLLQRSRGPAASPVFDFLLGNVYLEREQLDAAIAAYRVAVRKKDNFRRAWQNLGQAYIRKGEEHLPKAKVALTRVIELGGGDVRTYGALGFAHFAVEDYLAAETAFRMAILLDPKELVWKVSLARSLLKQERFAEVAALCRRLIADEPARHRLWLLQAHAHLGLRQPARAAECFEFVDSLGKSTAASLNALGDIYVNEELFDVAVDRYLRAMAAAPNQVPRRAMRAARVLARRGPPAETKQLVQHIESAFRDQLTREDRKELLRLRARLAMKEGAGEEEVRVLEEIVAMDPTDGDALIQLGQYYSSRNQDAKAILYFQRAAGLKAYTADANVYHAEVLVKQGKLDEALPLLRRAQKIKPRENVQKYLEEVARAAKAH
jgi:tetratricopeptide (TPR) repeat protein